MTSRPESAAPRTTSRVWVALAYALLIAGAAWSRWGGLSPPALGQDDLWVATIAKYASPADLLTYHAPVPMGFVAALQMSRAFFDDPELSVQIVAFVCGLALIPLSGWAATRLTGRPEIGLLAAVLVLLHPLAGGYSVRVKQFTWDAATLLALLGAALPRLDPEEDPRPWRLCAVSAAALLASFNSIFAGAALVHLHVVQSLVQRRARPAAWLSSAAAALAYDGFAALWYLGRLQRQSAEWIVDYWKTHGAFPRRLPSLAGGIDLDWLLGALFRAYATWLPRGARVLVLLAPLGLLYLLARRRSRYQGLVFTAVGVGAPLAALAYLYPFGGVRTDYYLQPLLAVLAAVGAAAVCAGAARTGSALGLSRPWAERLQAALPLLAAVGLLSALHPAPARYGTGRITTDYKDLVAAMETTAAPDDLVLLSPFSRWNVSYYTTKPMEIRFEDPTERLLDFHLLEPRTRVLYSAQSELGQPGLPDRVVFLAMLVGPKNVASYTAQFRRAGFRLESQRTDRHGASALQVWMRAPGGPPAERPVSRRGASGRESARRFRPLVPPPASSAAP